MFHPLDRVQGQYEKVKTPQDSSSSSTWHPLWLSTGTAVYWPDLSLDASASSISLETNIGINALILNVFILCLILVSLYHKMTDVGLTALSDVDASDQQMLTLTIIGLMFSD